jgi:hypothetical protein
MWISHIRCTICALALCAVMPVGCMNVPTANIREDMHAVPPGAGLLVGSVTQSSDGDPSPYHNKVGFIFTPKGSGRRIGRGTLLLKSGDDVLYPLYPKSWLEDRGLEDVNGRLFAVTVQPGTYVLDGFYIDAPGYKYHELAGSVTFEIVAGEILYVGNFDGAFCVRHAYANQYGVVGAKLSVNDRSGRDIPLLRDKFRYLQHEPIEVRVPDSAALQQKAKPLSKWCDCYKKCNSDL